MTTLIVVTEQHFLRAPDGSFHVVGSEDNAFFSRYLGVFDAVKVLSRAHDVASLPENARPVESDQVSFLPLLYLGFPANSTHTPRPHFRPHRISRKILYVNFFPT